MTHFKSPIYTDITDWNAEIIKLQDPSHRQLRFEQLLVDRLGPQFHFVQQLFKRHAEIDELQEWMVKLVASLKNDTTDHWPIDPKYPITENEELQTFRDTIYQIFI